MSNHKENRPTPTVMHDRAHIANKFGIKDPELLSIVYTCFRNILSLEMCLECGCNIL